MTALKDLKPLSPSPFFEVRGKVTKFDKQRARPLPNMTGLTGEGHLVDVTLAWSSLFLYFHITSRLSLEEGDSIDLFIDTRDLKNSNVMTRFCHHFIITPEEEEGVEVTRFRGEDKHELADPKLMKIETHVKRRSYEFSVALPKEVLHGYDPREFKRLGFAYRFQKKNGEKQHFNLSSNFFNLEKHPALWASLELVG